MNPRTRVLLLLLLATAVLWISNERLLYFRDNFSNHYPLKSLTSDLVRDGLPLWNPYVDGGQPLAGNANTLTFYPTTILYLFLPVHLAFNLHFVIHLTLAWFGMRRVLELYELSRADADRVAWIYLLSGTTVSCLVFYNLIVATAWMPWAFAALIRLLRKRRMKDSLHLGAFCGLIGLAAEPVVVIGFALLALVLFSSRFSRAAILPLALATLLAALVASPQLLAFSEIAKETERAHFRYGTEGALAASLGPDRVAELMTGPVYGSILDYSENGHWANKEQASSTLLISVMLSSLFLPAFLRRPGRELLPLQLLLLFFLLVALGRYNPMVESLFDNVPALGLVRYPEKFAILITLIATVLIGALLRDLKNHSFRLSSTAAIVIIFATVASILLTTSQSGVATIRLVAVSTVQALVLVPLIIPSRIRHLSRTLGLLALVPIAYWAAMSIPLDDVDYYKTPSPVAEAVGEDMVEVSPLKGSPGLGSVRNLYRFHAFRLNPSFGMRYGASYALSGSPEGMHSYLSRLAAERYKSVEPAVQLRYLRIHGATYTVRTEPIEHAGFELAGRWRAGTSPVLLYRIRDVRPLLWEPSSLVRAEHANEAVRIIESAVADTSPSSSVVPAWVELEIPPGRSSRVRLLSRSSQRMTFQVEAKADTVVVVNQTWFSAWRARTGDTELITFPADIDRLGIIVPAGSTTVNLEFGRHRLLITSALLASTAVLLYALGTAIVSSRRIADPAR